MKRKPAGLFNRLALRFSILKMLPKPVLDRYGAIMLKLPFLPENMKNSLGAFMVPRNKAGGMAFLAMAMEWILGAKKARKEGKKVVLSPFNFPPEIIHSFEKGWPLTSEMLSTMAVMMSPEQGEPFWDMAMGLGFPDHMCSANAIAIGSMLGTKDFHPDAIISAAAGSCDVNAKTHEFAAHYLDIPQIFLEKLPDESENGYQAYLMNFRSMLKKLEELFGEKLSETRLRSVMEKANRCTELYYELWDLHQVSPCPVPNAFNVFIYGTRFSMWGTDTGIQTMETLVVEAKKRLAAKEYPAEKEVARSLWCYTAYYFDALHFWNWMEETGITQLGDGLNLFMPIIIDTSSMDTMIEGLARSALNMPMTHQVGSQSMSRAWADDVIAAAKSLKADHVVFCGHHSCKQTWSVVSILREELMKRAGLPLLVLQGDSWMKRMTPMSVLQQEMADFVKNVVVTKSSGKRRVRKRGESDGGPSGRNDAGLPGATL